jgi:uncharacterized membrane protein
MPAWVLSAAYWLHMAATVAWVGGLMFQSLLLPAALQSLDPLARARLFGSIARRFQPIAWLSLAVLIFTGLTQMAAHPSYTGLLVIEGRWAQAILAKHLAFSGMVLIAAVQTWILHPRLARHMLVEAAGAPADTDAVPRSMSRIDRLTRMNAVLALIILAFTAIARTA